MINIVKSEKVEFSAAEMFALVANYSEYPEFISACKSARIVEDCGDNQVIAELELSFIGIKKTFQTKTTFYPNQRIVIELEQGPFEQLFGTWTFEQLEPSGSIINSSMSYSFKNKLLEKLVGSFFEDYCNNLIHAFHNRAIAVYKPVANHDKIN